MIVYQIVKQQNRCKAYNIIFLRERSVFSQLCMYECWGTMTLCGAGGANRMVLPFYTRTCEECKTEDLDLEELAV